VTPLSKNRLNQPVTGRMHQNFVRLDASWTVGQALEQLRSHPPAARIIYFYVVESDGRLAGVVPTRRLLLSSPAARLSDMMIRKVITLPATATVLEACEFFIQYRMLAFPVVDADGRIVGVVDVDLYTEELARLDERMPVRRLLQPFARFIQIESASGVVLLACAVMAISVTNSAWSGAFLRF